MSISLKQGLILKSSDGEYVYNIYSLTSSEESNEDVDADILNRNRVYNLYSCIFEEDVMIVDILTRNLEFIASRKWLKSDFKKQIEAGTIVGFNEGEIIGVLDEAE